MQRRAFLSSASRAAAFWAWTQLFAQPARADSALRNWHAPSDLFTLGVASGEPGPDSVVIWTRLAPQPLQPDGGMPQQPVWVSWEVAEDRRFSRVLHRGEVVTDAGRAHSVHVQVDGLRPGRTYFYRFGAAGQISAVGRTRTAPEPGEDVEKLRFALASCQHYEMGFFAAHRDMAAQDLDFVLFVGDYIYETQAPGHLRLREHPIPLTDRLTLEGYRSHHASYKLDPDLQQCHASHPWLLMWDDHEVLNDYDGNASPAKEISDDMFMRVREVAFRAYFEHMPVSPRRAPTGPNATFYTRYVWGRLAEFCLLDTRQYRDRNVCAGLRAPMHGRLLWRCDEAAADTRSMLGREQEHWLASHLARSTAHWRVVAQSTQMAPGLMQSPLGALTYADGWDAFPKARERLMAAIAQPRVPDVICLGGDVHRHVAANLRLRPGDPRSPIIASEFVTSSVTSRGLSEFLSSHMLRSNPDLLYLRGDRRGYALLDVSPTAFRCEFRGTLHPVKADAVLKKMATYVVERGVAGPQKA